MIFEWSQIGTAIAQGVLEGLTEFIPVSSTGHLILMGNVLEFTGEKADTFNVFIQLGAILAVVVLYYRRFLNLLPSASPVAGERDGFSGWNGIGKLFVTCVPALILGALAHETIKGYLFRPSPVAGALIVGGLIMIGVEKQKRTPTVLELEQISWRQCLGVGFFQCLAMWPGVSRSGATIIGAMLLGLERRIAAEFSFLVAVPIMCAAVGYDMLKSIGFLELSDIIPFAVGFVVSFLTAIVAIRFFISIVSRYTLCSFGYYRIALGALVLVLL